ncbi:MAG TPA: AAA family ATPase, partial [Acidobacteriota bacterium]|nr:AAA family ATPase [Acidobacteriota bacterium]
MHQIQKLEMLGFKSFCDRTQIVFNEGITAIVGPNGCGKSNIADAISWVVGEQSAKSLRTDRMEGVIFNGTQARKATSMSEVVLTLSLMEHFNVPEGLDLNPEGFTVGRRLYRSGESEYYLDGKRCRLKDIQALFEGTGLGPNSYALIEQGRIGQILSSKPADRRSLIEEAARITLFKGRRYSAEVKLEMAQQNLLRVNDIIREVVRQLNSLRRQAAKARRYNRLREELRGIQKLKFGMEERQLRTKLSECSARFSLAYEREQEILSGLTRAGEDRASGQEACRTQEALVDEARENLSRLKFEAGNEQSLLQNQEVQRLNLRERSKELDREQLSIDARRQVVEREQERLTASLQQLSEELSREQAGLDAEQAHSEVLQEAIRSTEGDIDVLRSFLINGAGRLSDLRNLQARCQENIRRIDLQSNRLESERESKERERDAQLGALGEARRKDEAIEGRQKEVSGLYEQYDEKSAGLLERIEQVSSDLTAQQEEFSLMQHRFSSLEEVERRRSNYSEGVQKFLSSRVPGEESPAAQTLADQVETDPAYEAAIEDYLNDPLQYILVDGLDDAVHSVERLKRIGAGKCTFMTMRSVRTNGHDRPRAELTGEGVVGYVDDLLRMREEIRHAFERVLPEYASTVMVTDLDTAFRVAETSPGSNFLTLNGEAYSPRGTLSAVGERKSMAGFLALKREKRQLEVKLSALRLKIQATRDEHARLKEEQAAVIESLKTLTSESRKLEVEAVVARHEIARLEEEIRKIDQTENVAVLELSQLLDEKRSYETQLAETAAGVAEIEERSRSGGEELQGMSTRLESLKAENAALAKNLSALLSAHAVRRERASGMETELRRLAGEADETRRRMEVNKTERSAVLSRAAELEHAQQQTRVRIDQCTRRIGETEADLTRKQNELASLREILAGLEERLRKLHAEREEA